MKKYDIVLVDLNPVKGSEQAGIRPCIIIQNDYANSVSKTFVIAIISSVIKIFPHTLIVESSTSNALKVTSLIDLLQVRTVDESRIINRLWTLDEKYINELNGKIKIAFWL